MDAVLLSLAMFFSTSIGGLFALRFRHYLPFILSFTAGVLLGVVSFDILPEIFTLAHQQGHDGTGAMIALVGGFLLFHSLEKFIVAHHAQAGEAPVPRHPQVGLLAALALAGHSFMDGVGIGLAFQVSNAVGILVALAVIAHDFCDGLNTVSLMLVHHNTLRRSVAMLTINALMPLVGAASTLLLRVPPSVLLLYLGVFAGFLLYIGASDILPEAHAQPREVPTPHLIGLTCLGAVFIFLVVRVIE
jgi:zinc transporter ZupT